MKCSIGPLVGCTERTDGVRMFIVSCLMNGIGIDINTVLYLSYG